MKTRLKKTICLLLIFAMSMSLCAYAAQEVAGEDADKTEPVSDTATGEMNGSTTSDTEAAYSETAKREMAILDAVDYGEHNFLTEAEFYELLSQILAIHGVEMTRYEGGNAYFHYNYSNVQEVKFLTMAKTMEEIEADQAQSWEELAAEAEEFAKEKAAIEAGLEYEEPAEDVEVSEEPEVFDASKDVLCSGECVTSFVLSSTTDTVDEQLMFLTVAAAWAILHPDFNNTDDSFAYLWRGLYSLYANFNSTVSTVDGIDGADSFRIPGNAVEAWMTTDDTGNYVVGVSLYADYDELIDIAGTSGTGFMSATTSLLG